MRTKCNKNPFHKKAAMRSRMAVFSSSVKISLLRIAYGADSPQKQQRRGFLKFAFSSATENFVPIWTKFSLAKIGANSDNPQKDWRFRPSAQKMIPRRRFLDLQPSAQRRPQRNKECVVSDVVLIVLPYDSLCADHVNGSRAVFI